MQEMESFSLAGCELMQLLFFLYGMLKAKLCGINNTEDDLQGRIQDEG
jgi:hypothetical protein